MLYHLFYELLQEYFSPLRVFQYITFRSIYAAAGAFIVCVALGPWMIRKLAELKIGQPIRKDGLQEHLSKEGTPTMGGLLILAAWLASTLLFAQLDNPLVWAALFAAVWFGGIGLLDDASKIRKGRSLGLNGRQKIALQAVGGLAVGLFLALYGPGTQLAPPFFKQFQPELPIWLYVPFAAFVLTASANSVNLTDGQDGLAIGCVLPVAAVFAGLSYVAGHAVAAEYLDIVHIGGAGELVVYSMALTGACLGFLWWNAYPAKVFMGDTGSMALGGAVGTVALAIKQELLLPILGGIFVANALSVMLQVWHFRRTGGKRLFRMAPLHHHFEKGGSPEPKVTVQFWIVGIILALVAVSSLKIR